MGQSLIAIIVVSDQEDCSSDDTSHLTPPSYLDPNNVADARLLKQGMKTRCHFNPQKLFDTSRYVSGFSALRPDNPDLVFFAAIVGVPPETVSPQVLSNLKIENFASLDQFYAGILHHSLMQPVVEDHGTEDPTEACSAGGDRGEIDGPPEEELFLIRQVPCEDTVDASGGETCARYYFNDDVLGRLCIVPDADSFDDYVQCIRLA